ncbi:MAG: DUF2851 family protein, partial [Muribaculaceae bacterium]|nr:DUF2851 family protein [Muribaculaceae bacterium]
SIPSIHTHSWLDSLAYSRLQAKSDRIINTVNRFHGDWEEACYITLSRALGFGINNDAFERLATSLPLRFMRKHSDSLLATEALLFGQAGLLNCIDRHDPYLVRLESEYRFLATKYSLQSPTNLLWKMARMRPANFPHRRIAFLASMMENGFNLMGRILEADTEEKAHELFNIDMTGYWTTHYGFGGTGSGRILSSLSDASVKILLINVVIPLQYAYGYYIGDDSLSHQAIQLLQQLPPEHNSIVSLFIKAGLKCHNAFESQAMIELRRTYCEQRKCLYCRFGHRLLSAKAHPESH